MFFPRRLKYRSGDLGTGSFHLPTVNIHSADVKVLVELCELLSITIQYLKILSTYQKQTLGLTTAIFRALLMKVSMNRFATMGDSGDHMAAPGSTLSTDKTPHFVCG